MFDTKSEKERVLVVGLVTRGTPRWVAEEHLDELEALVATAGGTVCGRVLQERPHPDPALFIGRGKAVEIGAMVSREAISLVVFDDDLSASQAKKLGSVITCKILDRSGLILDIFATRARTREARTQVELAQLEYLLPRLTRAWTHLSRQVGGIGVRGVGETQLEIDRRIVRDRIRQLKQDLGRIERSRLTQRRGRAGVFKVAVAGYTNAGKTTLFNRLAAADELAENKLFATLDARMRRWDLGGGEDAVLIDTVGFIRKLPHHLVASFRGTLEEVREADCVLHVIDITHPQWEEQKQVAEEVLAGLGVAAENILTVYNKIDRATPSAAAVPSDGLAVSATTGSGLEALASAVRERAQARQHTAEFSIDVRDGRLLAEIRAHAEILAEEYDDHGRLRLKVSAEPDRLRQWKSRESLPGLGLEN